MTILEDRHLFRVKSLSMLRLHNMVVHSCVTEQLLLERIKLEAFIFAANVCNNYIEPKTSYVMRDLPLSSTAESNDMISYLIESFVSPTIDNLGGLNLASEQAWFAVLQSTLEGLSEWFSKNKV